ncbi:hypothetical protein RCL1_008829 [Eukaryota sp. TZLM3-RCL]
MATISSLGPRLASTLEVGTMQEPLKQRPRIERFEPLFLPRPCLIPTFLSLLEKKKDQVKDLPFPIDYRMRFVLHFGLVSQAFRSCALEAVSEFFLSGNATFSYPKAESVLQWLQRELPKDSFKPQLAINSLPQTLPTDLSITALSITCSEQRPVWEFCSFLRQNNLELVESFTSNIRIGPNMCDVIAAELPSLRSLTLYPLSDDPGDFTFPDSLGGLFHLEFGGCGSKYTEFVTIDVSALINLKVLICNGLFSSAGINGLSNLHNLKALTLVGAVLCDELSSKARLSSICLQYVTEDVQQTIFSQKEVVTNAKTELLLVADLRDSIYWVYRSSLNNLAVRFEFETFSTEKTPLLESLCVVDSSTLILDECPRLGSCTIGSSLDEIEIHSSLQLHELCVMDVHYSILLFLLSNTSVLRSLKITGIHSLDEMDDIPNMTLSYLRSLDLSNSRDGDDTGVFLKLLPSLPRLSRMCLDDLTDIDLKFLDSKCPRLETLILYNCSVTGNLAKPNTSVTILKVFGNSSTYLFDCIDFLPGFRSVKHLTLEFHRDSLLFDFILLPPNVRFLALNAPYEMICCGLLACDKLERVSGTLNVIGDAERAYRWLDHFTSRKNLFSLLILN